MLSAQRRYSTSRGPTKAARLLLVLAAVLVAVGAHGAWRALRAPRPTIELQRRFVLVGRHAPLDLRFASPSGLRSLRVAIRQGEREHVVREETFSPPRAEVGVQWTAAREQRFRLAEGPGRLLVRATSAPVFWRFGAKEARLEQELTVRLTPPRVEVLTGQHYLRQGGCDLVAYRVTPPPAESGVLVGEAFFRGFPVPGAGDPAVHFALFALPHDADAAAPVRLRARDEAGNETLASFPLKVFPRGFSQDRLQLGEVFLAKVVPEILAATPSLPDKGDLLENYLQINRELRKANAEEVVALSLRSKPEFLWGEAFLQLPNSKVRAGFADRRTYFFQGREVDQQDHLGYDLASTALSPVLAANDGLVLKADYLGIYGNTVVLDHGHGLLTLYGHLSSLGVKPGQSVKRGQEIGRTGATGLAAGDHLHFSVLLQGVQVDAREWWDPHWVEDRLAAKLRSLGATSGPGAPR